MNIGLMILHVILSICIVTLVLLQKGDGASAGAAFGGGGAGSVFGASGSSNFLSKSTAILATLFFINCVALAYLAAHRNVTGDTVIDKLTAPLTKITQPVTVTTNSAKKAGQLSAGQTAGKLKTHGQAVAPETSASETSDIPPPAAVEQAEPVTNANGSTIPDTTVPPAAKGKATKTK